MKLISFIFPVYNEEEVLPLFYGAVVSRIEKLKDKYEFELLFVNDGSTDSSAEKLRALHDQDPRVVVINFSRNFGHQAAISAGIDHALGDAAVIMDSDLQDPPAVALELIKKWEEGFDVVYAQRKSRKDNALKKFVIFVYYRLLDYLSEISIPKDTGDFRLIDRKVIDELKKFPERSRYLRGLVCLVGFRQTGVLFNRGSRARGKSKYSLKKLFELSLDGIIGFSITPLKLIFHIGMWLMSLSILVLLAGLASRLFGLAWIPGKIDFLFMAVFMLLGLQMAMMGIMAIYIGRMTAEVKHRPLYTVSSVYSGKSARQAVLETNDQGKSSDKDG